MNNFPKYGSIKNLRKSNEVLTHRCVVTEKIHGTSARFVITEQDGLLVGTRNNTVFNENSNTDPTHSHYGFVTWLREQKKIISCTRRMFTRYVFYGEWFGPGVMAGIDYGSTEKTFRVFDIRGPNGIYEPWHEVEAICLVAGLETVPVLLKGIVTIEDLNALVNRPSTFGKFNGVEADNNTGEGVVIKPCTPALDKHGEALRAKYKSDKWAESHNVKKPRKISPEEMEFLEQADSFAKSVVTPGKMAVIIEHITREGNTELNMSRTGEFLREFALDTMKEFPEVYEPLNKKQKSVYNKRVCSYASFEWKKHINNL